eukprot:14069837-Alexandrium_andersonii.AAC.1
MSSSFSCLPYHAQIASPTTTRQAALCLAFRSVCRGWTWAPRWLPAGVGPLFGVSGCARCP